MPQTVQDIMNRELLAIRAELPIHEALELIYSFRVGAAPVLDESRRPVGVVSIRDLLGPNAGTAQDRMSRPALCVSVSATVEQAARQLARMDLHHLVVVDGAGQAVGMLSTLDVLRALLEVPARHPQTFPHWDEATGVSWTDEWPLDPEGLSHAPEGGGVLVIATDRLGERDKLVWVEAAERIRDRVRRLTAPTPPDETGVREALAMPGVRFRAALVPDQGTRAEVVAALRKRMELAPPPGTT
jgi:CBS domain-containing protein